ncbi:hypothetical protein QY97_00366 [Bacillus thermotolerans]|uniref:Uncharacterized protein n=1 Tax=Bacillus thermotolerans TaxID=1221996 RepID=A0A0F5IBK2_BACTR|nr:hypothetical protein QY96_03471 [Bacillus thermotolerans]KKB37201.1 hypothetical protein QY97_00366 [Bacillus thermotolerans]KKB42843.1 hypothetical protein QY95_03316 [Bacillus thermotolerans]
MLSPFYFCVLLFSLLIYNQKFTNDKHELLEQLLLPFTARSLRTQTGSCPIFAFSYNGGE